jgi:hypothetical protein
MGDFVRGPRHEISCLGGSGEAGRAQRGAAGTCRLDELPSPFVSAPGGFDRRCTEPRSSPVVFEQRLRPPAGVIRMELQELMSELARLLSRRSSTPRRDALRLAHRKIRRYAAARGLGENWCDAVLLHFLAEQHGVRGVA